MRNYFREYRAMPYEDRLIVRAILGLCFSAVLTAGKFVIGILTDINLCIIAVYTCAILLAKLQCVRGASHPSAKRVILTAVFLFFASAVYSAFMGSMAFVGRSHGDYGIVYVALLAVISFCEFGFAIRGMFRTKDKGYQYLNIKIIDFCIAMIALLTTQITILDYTAAENTAVYNSFVGMGVGILIALSALYVLIAPKVRLAGREHRAFVLREENKNGLIDMKRSAASVTLCRSSVYGSYVYEAEIEGPFLVGNIVRTASLWRRMHIVWKIVCCILSEILIFIWLFGRAIFFFRSMNLPKRLQNRMKENGFEEVAEMNGARL